MNKAGSHPRKRKRERTISDDEEVQKNPTGTTKRLFTESSRRDSEVIQSKSKDSITSRTGVPAPTDLAPIATQGHQYGSTTVDGNAHVHFGDSVYSLGNTSQIHSTSTVTGNMTVYNAYHSHPQQSNQAGHENSTTELKMALYYDKMNSRKAQLDQIDIASFEWVWTETSFPQWLESDNAITWISGKPASGKSTLMNHLVSHDMHRLKRHLFQTMRDPILIHFFFDFRSGTGTANSIVGMLRSFALQLLAKSKAFEHELLKHCNYRVSGSWPEQESEMLKLVCESIKSVELSICCFVDGLDEFEGDIHHLVKTIKHIQQNTGSKICLASRPREILTYSLGNECFAMQDRNAGTIRVYVKTAFHGLESYTSTRFLSSLQYLICQQAEGVILWARFATDEVVGCIVNGQSETDTLACLEGFPKELQEVYQRILYKLDPTEELQAAALFFAIRYFESSFGHPQSFNSKTLLMTYVRIMVAVGEEQPEFESDEDVQRFQLMVRALIKGLIEFVHTRNKLGVEPRIVHKSLHSFLVSDVKYREMESRINRKIDATNVGPIVLLQNTLVASQVLIKDVRGRTRIKSLAQYLRNCRQRLTGSEKTFYSEVGLREMLIYHDYIQLWCSPELSELLFSAMQTWICREWYKVNLMSLLNGRRYESTLSPTRLNGLLSRYPEAVELAFRDAESAMEDLMGHELTNLTAEDEFALRDLSLSNRRLQPSDSEDNNSDDDKDALEEEE